MTNPMLAELDEVVRLAEKATPGPWHRAQLANVVISESIDQWGLKQVISGRPADDWLCTAAVNFLRTHHATLADMAKRLEAAERDAAYGRALIEAMNAEYQAAKTSRKGGKQAEWLTTYCLLRRVKVAADHLTDMGNPITEQDQELAAIDATQEGEG